MADSRREPDSVEATVELLAEGGYVASRALATSVWLALRLGRPLLIEGEAGVGKTELGKTLATTLDRELVRLQCYEGLDLAGAAYDWNYPKQLLAIRLAEARNATGSLADIYSEDYLVARPLLRALRGDENRRPVLLIDELDRADEPFEAFLLELLSDFQLSIPELGTVRAPVPPVVIITSNRTREIHDALRRRCFYHWLEYPTLDDELRIVSARVPEIEAGLRNELVRFVQAMRGVDFYKRPGVAEAIDWAQTLAELNTIELTPSVVADTLGTLLKYQDDIARLGDAEILELIDSLRD